MLTSNNKPVFTFVVPSLGSGGAERVVSVLASELAEMGYPTHVIVHYKVEQEYSVSPKVDVYYDSMQRNVHNGPLGKVKKLLRIRKKIRSWHTDYLIPFLGACIVHTDLAARGLKLKFISTIRVNPRIRPNPGFAAKCDRIAMRSAALFAQTENEKAYYPEEVQKKTFVLANPVDSGMLAVEHTYSDRIRIIAAAGRLADQKNYPMLISAAEELCAQYPDLEFRIFGEGEKRDSIQKLISEKGLDNQVKLMGRSSHMADEFNRADLYVMTSNYEGMPNTLMEAMAVGLPCVSTDCPSGPSDLIEQGENGILVPLQDASALAGEIQKLLEHPDLARKMGEKARMTMQNNFTASKISERFVEECLKY